MIDVEKILGEAVKHFWQTRLHQHERQGSQTGRRDTGNRAAVTGGKHADGFVNLIAAIIEDAEIPNVEVLIHTSVKKKRTLPGFFRPCKEWDLVVTCDRNLLAVVEIKSQVGSFGNNFNNRVEEALGSATDFWTAYKYGAFKPTAKPWLGYLFMLEEGESSLQPTRRIELSPYPVDENFQNLSYAKRYEIVCQRMVREMLYDATCLFTSNAKDGLRGKFIQPNPELSIKNFAISLHARAAAFASVR